MQHIKDQDLISFGLNVLEQEATAIHNLAKNLNHSFVQACKAILNCQGRVIVTGIGKSGHIANKIAATLASTGTPAFFVHSAEAIHGDLGMITAQDIVLAISKSGETQEILAFAPLLKRLGVFIISLTCAPESTIAKLSDVNIDMHLQREACALNLAPTSSTTATLAMGDAIAISLLQARGFTADDFAQSHPGGKLGRTLLIKIEDIMQQGNNLPKVFGDTTLLDAMLEISEKRLGMTTVVDKNNPEKIIGICTDGDLRRAFANNLNPQQTSIQEIMSTNFKTIYPDVLAAEAFHMLQEYKISCLPVLERNTEKLIGALNIHNLFSAGVV